MYFLKTRLTRRREHKRTEKEMRRDGQKDQVTAMIQVQMEKDETTPELKNKWECKIREFLMATGSTDPFLPRLGPSFKVKVVYKDVHYKMLTLFTSLHLQAATQNVTIQNSLHKVCKHSNPPNLFQSYWRLNCIKSWTSHQFIFHLRFHYR